MRRSDFSRRQDGTKKSHTIIYSRVEDRTAVRPPGSSGLWLLRVSQPIRRRSRDEPWRWSDAGAIVGYANDAAAVNTDANGTRRGSSPTRPNNGAI